MGTTTTADGTQTFSKDWGTGQPVVFSHGWPLNADAWDDQALLVAGHGYRAVAHDRRGHGRSGQPWTGNELDPTPTTSPSWSGPSTCARWSWWATPPAAARSPATSAATAPAGSPSSCWWGRSRR
jgi:pimeloyl-ACP methyl ester carboxylesterase